MDQVNEQSGQRLGRLQHLAGLQPGQETPISWYANFPDHYAGDARPATASKGEQFLAHLARRLVDAIRAVKADRVAPALYHEFFERIRQ
jgi:creatinine amidohydrolase